jgi:hypothetical protein
MLNIRGELIRLYASDKKVADIVDEPQYQQLCEQYKGDLQFNGERALVEEVRKRLEDRLDGAVTYQDQVREALIELNKHRRSRHQQLYYDLIVKAYKPKWSTSQQRYFEAGWKLISSEYDFFLSFTTRYTPPGGENPINARYKYFIISEIDRAGYKNADRGKENLLVKALHRMLAQPPLRGFLFTEYENDNTLTEQKLRDACAKAIVFIQVVQNVMFSEPLGRRTNYCFFEYTQAKSSIQAEDHFLFVVAEKPRGGLIAQHFVPPRYDAWHKHVLMKDPPYLEEARAHNTKLILDLRKNFEDKIVQKVKDVPEAIFKNVPP